MRIEWLYPWIAPGEYLKWALVCREWRHFLQRMRYPKITRGACAFSSVASLKWAIDAGYELEPKCRPLVFWSWKAVCCVERVASPCTRAARFGSLECLKYLREAGYNWNSDTFEAGCRFPEIIAYLLENGCIAGSLSYYARAGKPKVKLYFRPGAVGAMFSDLCFYAGGVRLY